MSYLAKYNETLEQTAKRLAGNWMCWEAFAWNSDARPDDAEQCAIIYTTNRDADALTRSNHRVITQELEQFAGSLKAGQDLQWESHGHWAVGHVDGFSVRVFDAAGNITPAFRAFYELAARIGEYPALDDADWSDEEDREADTVWRTCYSVANRIRYIREHRDEFEFRSLADLMGCVRGKFFASIGVAHMKAIRTRKAFERVMAELARGDVDAYGASDHRETVAALRKYIRNCVPPSEFAEVSALSARVSEAEETGYHARQSNRARLELELRRAVAQAAYDRVSNQGR